MSKRVIMVCGPAASGKSHLVQKLLVTNAVAQVFCPDDYLMAQNNGQYIWTSEGSRNAWAHAQQDFARWLVSTTNSVRLAVWDATFVNSITRSPVLNFSKGLGVTVEAIIVQTDPAECMRRNALRPLIRRVPEAKLQEMLTAFQNNPPTEAEGFDLVTVYTTPVLGVPSVSPPQPCPFLNAGLIACKKPSIAGSEFCTYHTGLTCWVCGKRGAMECDRELAMIGLAAMHGFDGEGVFSATGRPRKCRKTLCGSGACYNNHSHN